MAENTAKTCVTYVRTSTQGQKDAMTIKAQRTTVERLRAQYGVALLDYDGGRLEDDGRSGRLLEGRRFAKFVGDVEAGRIRPDYLIVPSTSRLSREDTFSDDKRIQVQSAIDAARINSVLRVNGVKVIDTKGVHVDLRQDALEDSHERDKIRERTMTGKAEKFSEGKYAKGGKPLYGYRSVFTNGNDRREGFKLVAHPDEAPHVDRVLRWFVETNATEAARRATKEGVPLPMARYGARGAGQWQHVTIARFARLAGVYATGEHAFVFDGTPYTVKGPPLIDAKLYAAVERRRKERKIRRKDTQLSTGVLQCACGAYANIAHGRSGLYLRCAGKQQLGRASCGWTKAEKVHSLLWAAVVWRLIQIEAHEKKNGSGAADDFERELREAKAKVADVDREIDALLDLKANGLDIERWRARNDRLNERKAAAKMELGGIQEKRSDHQQRKVNEQTVQARVGAVVDRAAGMTVDERKQELRDLLNGDRVIVTWPKLKTKPKRGTAPLPDLTLPAFGSLPPLTFKPGALPPGVLDAAGSPREIFARARKALGNSMTDGIRAAVVWSALHNARRLGHTDALAILDKLQGVGVRGWSDAQVVDLLDALDKDAAEMPEVRCGIIMAHVRALLPDVGEKIAAQYRDVVLPQLAAKGKLTEKEFNGWCGAIGETVATLKGPVAQPAIVGRRRSSARPARK